MNNFFKLKNLLLVVFALFVMTASSASIAFAGSEIIRGEDGKVEGVIDSGESSKGDFEIPSLHEIRFYDYNNNFLESKTFSEGSLIVPPEMPGNPSNVWMNRATNGDILTATSTASKYAEYRPRYLGHEIQVNVHITETDIPDYMQNNIRLSVQYGSGFYNYGNDFYEPKYIMYTPGVNNYTLSLPYDYWNGDSYALDAINLVVESINDYRRDRILTQKISGVIPEESSVVDVETSLMIPYVNFEIEKDGLDVTISLDEHNLGGATIVRADLYTSEDQFGKGVTFDENKQCTLSRLPADEYYIALRYNKNDIFWYKEAWKEAFPDCNGYSPVFTADSYTIFHFYSTDEDYSAENYISTVYVPAGGEITAPEAPEVEGKIFSRWVDEEGNPLPATSTGEYKRFMYHPEYIVDSSDYTVYIYDGSYGQPINKKLLKTLHFDEPTEITLDNYFEDEEPFDDGTYVRGYWKWTPFGEPLNRQSYEEMYIGEKMMVDGPVELIVVYTNKRIDIKYLNDDDSLLWYYRAGQTSRLIYPKTPEHSESPDKYVFDHWVDEYGNKYFPGKSELDYVSDSRTLKAVYTAKKYNVAFKDYDGRTLFSSDIPYGEKIKAPEPKRDGYTFTGWNPEFSEICEGTAEYTAQYTKNPAMYTIRFVDFDDRLISTHIYKENSKIEIPAAPSREGYTFAGWSPNVSDIATSSVTYKAIYNALPVKKTYNITFKAFDGSIISSINYDENAEITVPDAPSREGYVFTNWAPSISTKAVKDAIYTARYAEKTVICTIRFIDYDYSLISSVDYREGENIAIPASPSREGYTFTGWTPSVNNKAMANATYKAVYEKKEEKTATPVPVEPTAPTPAPTTPTEIKSVTPSPSPAPAPIQKEDSEPLPEQPVEHEVIISESQLPVKVPEVKEETPEQVLSDIPVPKTADIKEKPPVQTVKEKKPLDMPKKKKPIEEISKPVVRAAAVSTLVAGSIGVGLATTGGFAYWWMLLGCLLFKKKYPKILGVIPGSKKYVNGNDRPIKKKDVAMLYESWEDLANDCNLAQAIDKLHCQNCYSVIDKSLQSIEIIVDEKLFTIEKSEFENLEKILCEYINFDKVEIRFVYDTADYSVVFIG